MEGKPRRPNFQPYIPVHRRNQQEQIIKPTVPRPISREESDVKKRGRGQFRAPSTDEKPITVVKFQNVDEIVNDLSKLDTEAKKMKEEKEDWEDFDTEELQLQTPINKKKTTKIVDEELTTVLDCYDFPNTFKTHHLQDIFKEYENMKGGYNIKWMDDTRALIVFEHSYTAKQAYLNHNNNPLIKIRPYKGQIEQKSSGPVPRRPATTDMVARRLVHGALGVRSIKTAEQRQAEKDLLRAAKEKRQAEKANNALRTQQIANAFDE